MRRIAPVLLSTVLLAGCASHVGNPADGLGGFLGDVLRLSGNPNRPAVDSPNARRVMGAEVVAEPLESEAGNIWPGPLPPARSMSDMQREMGGSLPPIDAPSPRGSSTPPAPAATPAALPAARLPAAGPVAPQPMPSSRVLQTPGGMATTSIGSNGVETFTLPGGRTGIVMPNANGTLTLIGPDGTTQTIPAPR